MWAAAENHGDVVELLLKHGANIDSRSKVTEFPKIHFNGARCCRHHGAGRLTALMLAARQGAVDTVVCSPTGGADLNLTDPDGTSALVMADRQPPQRRRRGAPRKGRRPERGRLPAEWRHCTQPSTCDHRSDDQSSVAEVNGHRRQPGPGAARSSSTAPTRTRVCSHRRCSGYHNGGDAQLTDGATPLMRAVKSGDLRPCACCSTRAPAPRCPRRTTRRR